MRKGSVKSTRINSEVQKEIAVIVQNELHDPGIHPMTTITGTIVSTDLSYCKVLFSVLSGNDTDKEQTLAALNRSKGYVRKRLAETVNLRKTPEITFVLDETLAYGSYMEKLIAESVAKDREAQKARGEET